MVNYYTQHFSCIILSWTQWSHQSSKKDDSMNLDDDDSIFNPVPQLQRYDDGDAPEVQSTQPVEPFPLQKKCMQVYLVLSQKKF